jgi:hypothetical protein
MLYYPKKLVWLDNPEEPKPNSQGKLSACSGGILFKIKVSTPSQFLPDLTLVIRKRKKIEFIEKNLRNFCLAMEYSHDSQVLCN